VYNDAERRRDGPSDWEETRLVPDARKSKSSRVGHAGARAVIAALALAFPLRAGAAPAPAAEESRPLKLIDAPTAEAPGRGVYDLNILFYPDGGLLAGINIGLFERFALGFTYGGLGIIGTGTPDWNPRVEFNARYQVAPETLARPALALGFDSQGYGVWDASVERYQVKSRGFYLVGSRNWSMMGRFALHGGVNYSVEGTDGKRRHNPSGFLGAEKSLGRDFLLLGEYDATLNDGNDHLKHGRLNLAAQWTYVERLRLQVDARNLLKSEETGTSGATGRRWSRGIQIAYRESF
jgi:hypothetical protein